MRPPPPRTKIFSIWIFMRFSRKTPFPGMDDPRSTRALKHSKKLSICHTCSVWIFFGQVTERLPCLSMRASVPSVACTRATQHKTMICSRQSWGSCLLRHLITMIRCSNKTINLNGATLFIVCRIGTCFMEHFNCVNKAQKNAACEIYKNRSPK